MLRFVDRDRCIREEFLGFITVERITGKVLATALLSWFKEHNIDILFCKGQGYDGASKYVISHQRCTSFNTRSFSTNLVHTLSQSPVKPLYCQGMLNSTDKKC